MNPDNIAKPRAAMELISLPVALATAPTPQPCIGIGVSETPASSIIGGRMVQVVSVMVAAQGAAMVAQMNAERARQLHAKLGDYIEAMDPTPVPEDAIVGEDASGESGLTIKNGGWTDVELDMHGSDGAVYVSQGGDSVLLTRDAAVKVALSILATVKAQGGAGAGESVQ